MPCTSFPYTFPFVFEEFTRCPKESLSLRDELRFYRAFHILDGFNLADYRTRISSWIRLSIEPIELSDSILSITSYFRKYVDGLQLSDIITTFIARAQSLWESFELSEAIDRIWSITRLFSETFNLYEIIDITTALRVNLNEFLTLADLKLRKWNAHFKFLQSIILTDHFKKFFTWFFKEKFSLSDFSSTFKKTGAFLLESLQVSDLFSRISTWYRNYLENLGLSGITSTIGTLYEILKENLQLSDKLRKGIFLIRRESLSMIESILIQVNYLRNVLESIALEDYKIYDTYYVRRFYISISLKEVVISATDYIRSLCEIFSIYSDVVKKRFRHLFESLVVLDQIRFYRTWHLIDQMLLKVQVNRPAVHLRKAIENLELSEIYNRVWSITRRYISPIGLSGILNYVHSRLMRYTFKETIQLTDSIITYFAILIHRIQSIGLSDIFDRRLNWKRLRIDSLKLKDKWTRWHRYPIEVLKESFNLSAWVKRYWTWPTQECYEKFVLKDILRQPCIRAISDFLTFVVYTTGIRATDIYQDAKRILNILRKGIRKVKVLGPEDVDDIE